MSEARDIFPDVSDERFMHDGRLLTPGDLGIAIDGSVSLRDFQDLQGSLPRDTVGQNRTEGTRLNTKLAEHLYGHGECECGLAYTSDFMNKFEAEGIVNFYFHFVSDDRSEIRLVGFGPRMTELLRLVICSIYRRTQAQDLSSSN
jgi:hypothetical protein